MNSGAKYAHASVGILKNFEGKQFVKEATGATSCEISFGSLPEQPFPSSTATGPMRKTTSSSPVQAASRWTTRSSTSPKVRSSA